MSLPGHCQRNEAGDGLPRECVNAAHGPEYATQFLELVGHFLGAEDALDLHQAFARCGVVHSYRGEEQCDFN